ncbi:uncharacterized protein BJX67DRAFT_314377 [Aspergillus lucknowensis]|uniref:Secreted protein n=1 Tax=Aspergillus lucknowensis TaxID=176173 RepID=A0ABR4LCM5_9EURO
MVWLIASFVSSCSMPDTSLGSSAASVLYRAFFHPLRNFPGPPLAKLSALWPSRKNATDSKFHATVDALHEKYGDFVRIPRARSPSAMPMLFGTFTGQVPFVPRALSTMSIIPRGQST